MLLGIIGVIIKLEDSINQMAKKGKYHKLLEETQQAPHLRQLIIQKIENQLNKTILTFFTSFRFPVMIEDQDAVLIEEVLQNTNLKKDGFILIINSLGGSGLAAERIINVCRTYSNNNFEVIVPNQAKSAATIICLGSNKIHMSSTSEIGPIDPQLVILEGETKKVLSAHSIITSYNDLIQKANRTKGNIEPYLQQLARYDAREIEEYKRAMELSESIAVKYLKEGMMSTLSMKVIKEKLKPLLSPLMTKSHGRPIFIEEAKKCGLNINKLDYKSKLWENIWDLYIRTDYCLKKDCIKVVESSVDNYIVGV